MMIYFITFILLLLLAITYDFNKSKRFSSNWYNIVLIVFILIAGLRYKVGGDTQSYYEYYKSVTALSDTSFLDLSSGKFAIFWNILASSCKSISEDFVFLQIIHAIFINVTLFWFIKKYSAFKFTSLLFYFMFAFLYFNMEIMRESIAISFFLLAYPYFTKKKWLKYYILIFVAFLFHNSAIILFIFPLMSNLKYSKRNLLWITFCFLAFMLVLAKNPQLINILLVNETIEGKFNLYSEYVQNINGKILVFVSFIILPLYLIMINRRSLKDRRQLFENLYLIYFMLAILYLIISGFSRFINYLTPFMIVYFSYTIHNIYRLKKYQKIKRLTVIFIVFLVFYPKILYYTADTSRFYPETKKYNLYYPYSSIFYPEEYIFRSIIFQEGMRESTER